MDYLTVLATQSLILFSHPKANPGIPQASTTYTSTPTTPTTPNTPHASLPLLSPTTSEHSLSLLPPSPVTLPLQSLAWSDSECAYFLLSHLLSTSIPADPVFGSSPGSLGAMEKRMANEAEGIVWKEINKGKAFVRSIGEWFGGSLNGKMEMKDLRALADGCGVVLDDIDEHNNAHEVEEIGMTEEQMIVDMSGSERGSVNDISMSGHSMVMA